MFLQVNFSPWSCDNAVLMLWLGLGTKTLDPGQEKNMMFCLEIPVLVTQTRLEMPEVSIETSGLYLSRLLHPYLPPRSLRSSGSRLLSILPSRLRSMGDRAFSVAGPPLWSALPLSLRQCPSITTFKSQLTTHLFKIAFPDDL